MDDGVGVVTEGVGVMVKFVLDVGAHEVACTVTVDTEGESDDCGRIGGTADDSGVVMA